jgi:hypothetical protein
MNGTLAEYLEITSSADNAIEPSAQPNPTSRDRSPKDI